MISRLLSLFGRRKNPVPPSVDSNDFVTRIARFVRCGDIDRAVERVKSFQMDHPHDKKTLCNASIKISEGGYPGAAVDILSRAVDLNPGDPVLTGNLAAAYLNDDCFDQALDMVDQSILLDSQSPNACKLKASILRELDRVQEARSLCETFLEHSPNSSLVWFAMGMNHMELDDEDQAIECFSAAYKLDPTDFRAFANIAAALIGANRLEEGERAALEALEINPDDGMTLCNLGLIYEKHERFDEAINLYQKSCEVDPRYTRAKYEVQRLSKHLETK